MSNSTVPTIAINGAFNTAEHSDTTTTPPGTLYLLWSDVCSTPAGSVDTEIGPVGATEAIIEEDDSGEEVTIAEASDGTMITIGGFGRDIVTDDPNQILCPHITDSYDDLVYGDFEDSVLVMLYEDLCTAKLEEVSAALVGGETFDDPDAECGPAAARAFAHYAAGAIAGFINNLKFEIELHADPIAASAVSSESIAISTAGSAAAQTGTATAVTDITAAIEASTFTVTVKTKG